MSKNKKDLDKWIHDGLVDAALYWYQTYGLPVEMFKDLVHKRLPTKGHQILFLHKLYKKGILKYD
jgi:hypothetical protein